MAGKLGVLTLDLVARIGQFVEPMKNAERQTKASASNMARDFEEADKGISMSAKNIGLSLAGVAASYVSIDRLINTQRTFDKLNAGLITATGSAEGAAAAFDSLQKFAKETPYGLEQSVQAFIRLKNLGLNPSEAALMSYGNTAAAMGGDLIQMIEAVADATTGEFERLKAFGIKASQENGKVSLVFKGQTTTIKNNAKEIEKYLLRLGNVDFASASTNRMKTLDGSISNLEDTIDSLFLKVSQSGIGDAIKAGVDGTSESLETLGDNLDTVGDIALVVGAIFAGRYSASMIESIQKTVAASIEQKQALVAEKAANVQLLSTQMQAARSKVGALTAEQNLLIARIRQNTNLQERIVLEARATQVAIQLAVAERQATASTAAYTAATSAATGATSRLAAAKALLLGLTGGWVGLGLTVASVAAGYLLMKGGADESTKSLRENNESVDDAINKYKELDDVRRRSQLVSERDKLRDLGQEYEDINSKLITATYSFSRHNDMTSEQSKQVNALIAEYKKTGDIDQFSGKINALNFISQTSKDRFNTLGGSVKDAGNEFKNQKSFVDQMAPALQNVSEKARQGAIETANLSAEIRKLLSEANQTIKDSAITSALANRGYNDTMIELAKKYLNVEGAIVTNAKGQKVLKDELKTKLREEYQAIMRSKNAVDERNKAEEKSKKLLEATGNAMKVNALVASNAAKANYAALESAKGLPKGLLSAVNMIESPNSNTARSSAGARGAFQFMPKTAERFNVDVNSVNSSAKGAAEYLDKLLKMFEGNLENALRAYNWGEGNMQNYLKYGSGMKNGQKGYFADRPMPRETREYSGKVMGYMGGSSGISFTEDYSFDDWLKEQEQFAIEREKREKELVETKKAIQISYHNEWQALEFENQERIKEIEKAFATDPTERDRLLGLQQKAYEEDVANWVKAQDERVKAENEANQQILIDRYKFLNDSVAMYERIAGLSSGADEIFARSTMSPEGYGRWSLANDRSNSQAALKKERVGVEQDIMTSNLYSTDDERYEALKEAHQQYRDGLAAIDVKYYQDLEDLQNQTQAASLAGYGAMFGMMGSMLDAYGAKESTAYKVAFAMQKGFVLSSAILNAKGAIMSAWNDPSNVTMWQKIAGAAAVAVQTNDLMSAIQGVALSGMAHDGIDNIPKEGTWLLDKGERVVDSRTNADLKDYLAKGGGSGGGDVNITVHVTDSGVSTQSNQNEQKQLGQMIGNAVRTIIRQEQRQGGLLSK